MHDFYKQEIAKQDVLDKLSVLITVMILDDVKSLDKIQAAVSRGIQLKLENNNRRANEYWDAMISALIMTDGKRLDTNLKKTFIGRIIEVCKHKSCGAETNALEKYNALLAELNKIDTELKESDNG